MAASTSRANGALKAWTSAPPTAGPAMNDVERLMLSLAFASTYSRFATRLTKNGG